MFFWIKKSRNVRYLHDTLSRLRDKRRKKTKRAERNINSRLLKEQYISQMLKYNKFEGKSFREGKKAAHIRKTPKLQIV